MYYLFLKDCLNNIYSIDNLVIEYNLYCNVDTLINVIQDSKTDSMNYWEKLNCSKCSRYSYYSNIIHFDDGIYIRIGKYSIYDDIKKKYHILPILSVELNPNKHYQKDSFSIILNIIKQYCVSGRLVKYDFAIDFPIPLNDIQVFSSRKEKGLCKGTRYYGQRNKNGYCKIYDKKKELKLDGFENLTRVEHTCSSLSPLSLECLSIADSNFFSNIDSLSASRRALVQALTRLKDNNIDYDDIIYSMDRMTRSRLMPYLSGNNYKFYEYELNLLDDLLLQYSNIFKFNYTDSNGFMGVSDEPLPFD